MMKFLGMHFGKQAKPTFEAAVLPKTEDVVISCDQMLSDERIPAAKARAIYLAVCRHDAVVQAELARNAQADTLFPSIQKSGEQSGEHGGALSMSDQKPA